VQFGNYTPHLDQYFNKKALQLLAMLFKFWVLLLNNNTMEFTFKTRENPAPN
jgi:hypothetical protein